MPRIRIDVAEDGMAAHISVGVGAALVEADAQAQLSEALAAASVRHGVDAGVEARVLAVMVAGGEAVDGAVLARGLPMQRGFDGYFAPDFEPGIRPGHLRDDGTMDFRDRELLKTVRAGEAVGRQVAPGSGVPGVRVDGSEVPAVPGTPSPLKLGEGVKLADDGTVTAVAGGAIVYVPKRSIAVVRELGYSGDVDLRSGHLTMQGSVRVQGNVTRGFHVHATGDIDVRGDCEGGELRALGNVRVRGSIRGGAMGIVEAQGDVFAKRGESAEISAGGSVCLAEAVHCSISAYEVAIEKRVVGGRIEAEHFVVAGNAGSAQGVPTELAAGVVRPTRDELVRSVASAKAERQSRARVPSGPRGDERPKGGKLGRDQVERVRDAIEQKLATARARDEARRRASVSVSGELHAGCVVIIGDARWDIGELVRNVRFTYDETTSSLRLERTTR
jgi:uncharacterized protein